jgi:PHD/YefM family antitoxin component YafN of YafNO toxin-antitoxin module
MEMQKFTVEEFQADFDNLLEKIENGESLIITSEYGNAMMIPYGEYKEVDDLIRIYTDHEEGS